MTVHQPHVRIMPHVMMVMKAISVIVSEVIVEQTVR